MVNKIAISSTGQATFAQHYQVYGSSGPGGTREHPITWQVLGENGQGDGNNWNPNGWGATSSGGITVPSNAAAGLYVAWTNINVSWPAEGLPSSDWDRYEFEVVCMTAKIRLTNPISEQLPDGKWKHSFVAAVAVEGGTAPFTYAWSISGSQPANVSGMQTEVASFTVTTDSILPESTNITVSVTVNSSDGCSATDSTSVISPANQSGSGSGISGSGSGLTDPGSGSGISGSASGIGSGSGSGLTTPDGGSGSGISGSGSGLTDPGSGSGSGSGSGLTDPGSGSGSGSGLTEPGSGSGISGSGSGSGSGHTEPDGGSGSGSGSGSSGISGSTGSSGISGSGAGSGSGSCLMTAHVTISN